MRGHVARIQTDNVDVDRLQTAIIAPLNGLLSLPILDGRLITGVSVVAGQDNPIEHKLGREYQGYWITGIDAGEVVFTSSVQNKGKFLTLDATGNVTVSLWVF